MLTGPRLSEVQHRASIILDIVDRIEKLKQKDWGLRLALLASTWKPEPEALFDELKEIVTDDSAELADDTVSVRYEFAHVDQAPSQAEVEEEIRRMLVEAATGETSFEMNGEWV